MKKLSFIIVLIITLSSCKVQKTNYVSHTKNNNSESNFIVFVADQNHKKIFYGFHIGLDKDSSDLIFSNQYRIQKAEIYKFNDTLMIKQVLQALTYGESEFVYKTPNKVDFTGGYHGDEQLIEVDFFVDGKPINLEKTFTLLPFKTFRYKQKSTMHESSSKSTGINIKHPVEAVHLKTTDFDDNGYKTNNIIQWQKNVELEKVYGSLVCLSRDFGEYGKSKSSDTIKLNENGKQKLSSNDTSITLWNTKNKTKVSVISEFSLKNESSRQWIWDHRVYSKYYRDVGKTTADKGDEWVFKTKVKFNFNRNPY
jgi:hypothetical protein